MGEIFGKICPYCNQTIFSTEDAVLCSDCHTPHHKDCWIQNHGCTTFDCVGTMQRLNPSDVQKDIMYCAKCGTRVLQKFAQTAAIMLLPLK